MAAERDPVQEQQEAMELLSELFQEDQDLQALMSNAKNKAAFMVASFGAGSVMNNDIFVLSSVVAILTKVVSTMHKDKSSGWSQQRKFRIPESKGASNLRTFSGEKKEFQEWQSKLINQFTIVYKESRELFKSVVKHANMKETLMTDEELHDLACSQGIKMSEEDYEKLQEDLHYILVDKTSGEARTKVDAEKPGSGLTSFMKLYLWYSSSSGEAIQERIGSIMSPPTPKKDEDLAGIFEAWIKEVRLIEELGADYHLPYTFKVTAIKIMMGNKRDRFDHISQMVKNMQGSEKDKYDIMVQQVRELMAELRLQKFKGSTPMQLDEAAAGVSGTGDDQEDASWNAEEAWDSWS